MYTTEALPDFPDHYFTLGRFHLLFAKGLPILLYHKIGRAPILDSRKGMFVSRRLLAEQLRELKHANYRFGSIEHPEGERSVVISFDDGYLSCFEQAMPVLGELRCKAIQYITTARIGKTNDWDGKHEPLMEKS
jgi:peptidoglycan/xylan/chitin deacetylase (PgdA/CDA1 family)